MLKFIYIELIYFLKNIFLQRHSEGVVKVTFKEAESADLCVSSVNNRMYCERRLIAQTWDGKQKFRLVK